jgi:phage baseplate assembly protein W
MISEAGRLLGRGVSFPPRIGADGRVTRSEGDENVRESIRTIVLTDPGERVMLPDFGAGLRGFLFEPNTPASHRLIQDRIVRSLRRWEPRIAVTDVAVDEDPREAQQANVTISYELVATAGQGSLDLSVRLAG